MSKEYTISIPIYTFNDKLVLEKVGKYIDGALLANFKGKDLIIRGIQSEKHKLPKNELINQIIATGTDRYSQNSKNEVRVSDKHIDLFGYARKIDVAPIVLPILEGFHKWKPKSLERPRCRVDLWMVYDVNLLENVEYTHMKYKVKSKK